MNSIFDTLNNRATKQVAKRCASKNYMCASVGKAKVVIKGKYCKPKVLNLLKNLDKYNPDADTLKLNIGKSGVSLHIGKHITGKRIFFTTMAGAVSVFGVWYVGKYMYNRATKSMDKPPKEEDTPNFESYNISDLQYSDKRLNPMIGQMLPENYDCLLYGEKGCMKSTLALGTMIQLGLGVVPQILPPDQKEGYTPVSNVRCIYVDGENGQVILKERYKDIIGKLGFLKVIEAQSYGNGGDKLFQEIRNACKNYPDGTKIVIGIDNLKSVANELSPAAGKDLLNNLKKLRAELDKRHITLTSLIIHHTDKSGKGASGSYTFPCLTPFVFKLEYNAQEDERVLVVQESRTYRKGERYLLNEVNGDYLYLCNDHLIECADRPVRIPKEDEEIEVEWEKMNPWGIPLELALEIEEFYKQGVSGYGYKTTIARFNLKQYGINDGKQVSRLLEKLKEYQKQVEQD